MWFEELGFLHFLIKLIAPRLSLSIFCASLSTDPRTIVCAYVLRCLLAETPQFGWGLHAERDVELGEKLAILPRSMCLGLAAVGSDDACEPEDNSWLGPPEVQALVQKIPRMYPDLRWGYVLVSHILDSLVLCLQICSGTAACTTVIPLVETTACEHPCPTFTATCVRKRPACARHCSTVDLAAKGARKINPIPLVVPRKRLLTLANPRHPPSTPTKR